MSLNATGFNPAVVSVPSLNDINWCFSIVIGSVQGSYFYTINGGNDDYPAYEVYLNGQALQQFTPTSNNAFQLQGNCNDVFVSRSGTIP